MGIGTTLASFQESGKKPEVRDRLNRRARLGAIDEAVAFSILAEMSSGPVDLLQSRLESNSRTEALLCTKAPPGNQMNLDNDSCCSVIC